MAVVRYITHRQMRAVEIWVRGGCKSKARALREAGYGKSITRHPWKVFDTAMVLDELAKRGLNKYGMRGKMSWESEDEVVLVERTPELDVSKIPEDQLIWLKEKFAEMPD